MIGIYKITSPNGKVYIGQSINIEKRFNTYYKLHCKSQIILYNSFVKYGIENHKFEILEECLVKNLNIRERFYQDNYNVLEKGLNCKLTHTNNKSGFVSIETKIKMSKSSLLMTQETKNKIGNSNKGKKRTEEFKKNISLRMIGINKTEIQKNNISKKLKGIKRSDEFKLKCSLSKKGKKINHSYRAKIILDYNTGIYYYSIKELCEIIKVNRITFYDNIIGKTKINKYSQYKYV